MNNQPAPIGASTPKLKAALTLAALSALVLAGCTGEPVSQNAKANTLDLTTHHVHAVCSISIDANRGLHAALRDCNMTLVAGKLANDAYSCTGLSGNVGTFSIARRGTITMEYYAPSSTQSSQVFKYDAGDGHTAVGSCTIDGRTPDFGSYTVRMEATCFKDASNFWPGLQYAPDGCASQDDTLKLARQGGFF